MRRYYRQYIHVFSPQPLRNRLYSTSRVAPLKTKDVLIGAGIIRAKTIYKKLGKRAGLVLHRSIAY